MHMRSAVHAAHNGVTVQEHSGRLQLPGEDALLSWPGAWDAIITQRDAYMAATTRAAALGECNQGHQNLQGWVQYT